MIPRNNSARSLAEPHPVEISPSLQTASRRPSTSNFARFAFNIYGSQNNLNSATHTPPSSLPRYTSGASSYSQSYSQSCSHSYSSSVSGSDSRARYTSPTEIQCLAPLNGTVGDFAVIAGKNLLQVLRVSTQEIKVEWDLLASNSARHNQKLGSISDVCAGYDAMGRMVATASTSGSIFIYDYTSKQPSKLQHHLSNHTRAVNSLDFSTHNPYSILSGSQDGTMKVWDLRIKSSKPTTTIQGNAEAVRCVKFLPHLPRKLVAIFDLGVIKKWDVRMPGQYEKKLNAHTGPGLSLGYHPELDYIASGGRDKQIQIWNMGSQGSERTPDYVINTSGPIARVDWGPLVTHANPSLFNHNIALCFMNDVHSIQVWNLKRKYIPLYIVKGHTNQITGFHYKSDRHIWSCSKDHTFVQTDLTQAIQPLRNLPSTALAWGNGFADMIMIDQHKQDFGLDPSFATAIALPERDTLSPIQTMSSSPTSYYTPVERPVLTRSTTLLYPRPPLPRTISRASTGVSANGNTPYAVPVSVPIPLNDDDTFEYLTNTYLTEIPEGMDMAAVCGYHAAPQLLHSPALTKWTSNKSELTKQLRLRTETFSTHTRESQLYKEIEPGSSEDLVIPWGARQLIEKAAEYAADQGNIVLCATLTLLFYNEANPVVEKQQALEWIYLYIQILNRKGLFTIAIDIMKKCEFEEIRLMGQNETTLRTYCPNCLELVVNERTKKRNLENKDTGADEGFWWCDKCRKCLGKCIYCNEPVKGMALAFLSCGHMGHFGCLREWFIWDENTECPSGCGTVVL
ncbi:hypothetical protein BABINDRAFT_33844 [Babjeviella inositovora NRRL Y-12698]|uniref:Restriction of telomere capping protein 1 n=1 Tax=Babjeviella inositovora NRRL Y-12698 TaxID=984486 RepID=A0A1E3QVU2_9ASCO|nr:uncharacterized protein BABINDRAFT_33844 [Babjeviella inositovora NRRL Y-12698]ODQ81202.1 hypothetical protein BABINDRAFT_33844 [Babjeviella inositovora NRRL Y-12698]